MRVKRSVSQGLQKNVSGFVVLVIETFMKRSQTFEVIDERYFELLSVNLILCNNLIESLVEAYVLVSEMKNRISFGEYVKKEHFDLIRTKLLQFEFFLLIDNSLRKFPMEVRETQISKRLALGKVC